jgi:hypothetical protein
MSSFFFGNAVLDCLLATIRMLSFSSFLLSSLLFRYLIVFCFLTTCENVVRYISSSQLAFFQSLVVPFVLTAEENQRGRKTTILELQCGYLVPLDTSLHNG